MQPPLTMMLSSTALTLRPFSRARLQVRMSNAEAAASALQNPYIFGCFFVPLSQNTNLVREEGRGRVVC